MCMICPASRAIKKLLTLPSTTKWVMALAKEPRPYNFVNKFALVVMLNALRFAASFSRVLTSESFINL